MKHLRLFENTNTIQSMRNIINEYDNFRLYIEPFIMDKYNEMAESIENEDEDEYPEYGDSPTTDDTPMLMQVDDIGGGFRFHLQGTDNHGEVLTNYYIEFKDAELEKWIKESETRHATKKYNI